MHLRVIHHPIHRQMYRHMISTRLFAQTSPKCLMRNSQSYCGAERRLRPHTATISASSNYPSRMRPTASNTSNAEDEEANTKSVEDVAANKYMAAPKPRSRKVPQKPSSPQTTGEARYRSAKTSPANNITISKPNPKRKELAGVKQQLLCVAGRRVGNPAATYRGRQSKHL